MNIKFDFSGKVALVTGASSGIGRATAELFGASGASVAIVYHRNERGANETIEKIREGGARAIAIQADFTRNADVFAAVERTQNELGAVDVLINNAGSLVERLRTADLTEERWDEVFALNTKSAFFAAKAVIPAMLEKGAGVIVNVSSIAGRNGGALGSIHYSAAKGAVITMTKGLAKEFAASGIRVNAVSPGVIDTPFHETFSTPEAMLNFAKIIPQGRVGTSAEVAAVIAFLASDAASYLCGETIEINGGMIMD
ncbi:MAG TPA: glucose 1-dehydrogenase [Pyrinomonadaceae bacterium]|jgi:3-oxoacyl-[acyl-carrier protein] reductase